MKQNKKHIKHFARKNNSLKNFPPAVGCVMNQMKNIKLEKQLYLKQNKKRKSKKNGKQACPS